MNDPLNEVSVSPYKVRSFAKALELTGVQSNIANTASNTNATVAMLNDIKTQNTTIISNQNDIKTLLQQLVDK